MTPESPTTSVADSPVTIEAGRVSNAAPTPPTVSSNEGVRFASTTFENGLIGKWEAFYQKRFGIGPLYSRSLGSFMVSTVLHDVFTSDAIGVVKPSLWFLVVTPTGGMKTPPLQTARGVIRSYNPRLLGPARFTVEGLTAFISGRKGKQDEHLEEEMVAHEYCAITRDEFSSLLEDKAKRKYLSGMSEFLSELWDGNLQGYQTRGNYSEGNVPVYISLFGAASTRLLSLLDEDFFIQGLGNRLLWIDEKVKIPPFESDFFRAEAGDSELEALTKETHEAFRFLEQNCTYAVVQSEAWLEWANNIRVKLNEDRFADDLERGYVSKQLINSLKLAMVYAASRYSVLANDRFIIVTEADVALAIADTESYINMWRSLVAKWRERVYPVREVRLPTRKIDLGKVLRIAASQKDGLFTKEIVKAFLDTSDAHGVLEIISLGQNKKYFELLNEEDMKPDEVERFKPKRGPSPQVFKLTEEGLKAVPQDSK